MMSNFDMGSRVVLFGPVAQSYVGKSVDKRFGLGGIELGVRV